MTCEVRLMRVVGLPAILDGRHIGYVEQAALSGRARELQGVVIRRGLGGARWIGRQGIALVGDVSLVLRCKPGRMPREQEAPPSRVTDGSGLMLGRVTDAWIHPETLEVTALEVTLGLCEDLLRGRLRVRHWDVQPGDDGRGQIMIGRREWEVLR